ncbi:MAG: hypothetical protein DRP80_00170 [Candidatus Omnitrophota bacterium]|nr:MAG: hypothetical protein DRP80_00170 [Candidatus Omnitrophota bacterium]
MYSLFLKIYINQPKAEDLSSIWENPASLLEKAYKIKTLKVIKKEKNRLYTRWEVDIEGAILSWYEEDILDRERGLINFKMRSGDFGDFFGYWKIVPTRWGKLRLEFKVNYDWGIPVLEPYVKRVLEKKARVMWKSFLQAVKQALESNG